MATTYTAAHAVAGAPAKSIHAGVNCLVSTYSFGAAPVAGDVIKLAKIPNGATILAVQRSFAAGSGNVFPIDLGVDGAADAFGSGTGAASIAFQTKGLPYRVSLTDAASPQYTHLIATIGTVTSGTATGSISVTVLFAEDV